MPIRLLHPHFVPAVAFDAATHEVQGVSGNSILRGGVHAWVEMPAQPRTGDLFGSDAQPRLARFRVPVRPLLPGPSLGPRDPDVMAWIERWGWLKAVERCEARWIERRTNPKKWAQVQRQQLARDREAEKEAQRRRREDARRPGLWDEFISRLGEIAPDFSGLTKFIKWSAIGGGAIGGTLVLARLIEAVRR